MIRIDKMVVLMCSNSFVYEDYKCLSKNILIDLYDGGVILGKLVYMSSVEHSASEHLSKS